MKISNLRVLIGFVILLGVIGCTAPDSVDSKVVKSGGEEIELYANSPSRTSNDGIYTHWSESDRINVFHVTSGGNNYINDGEFTLREGATSCFRGNLNADGSLVATNTYDWFVDYPYSASLLSPNGEGANFTIGSTATSYQTQVGNNSTAHMAGEQMPLVGGVKGVAAQDSPAMTLKNVASMVEMVVQNKSDDKIAVKQISLSVSGCGLVGSFRVDFSQMDNIQCSPVSGESSNMATLRVEGGENLSANSQASFYVAVAPCVAKSGAVISFDITLQTPKGEKIYSKSQTLTDDITFSSGKTKRVILNYNNELDIVEIPVGSLPPMQSDDESRVFRTRVMCYNIRNGNGSDDIQDFQRTADAINRANVDVVALQEVDSMTTRNPMDVLKIIGNATGMYPTFGAAINHGKGKYGVGVLSKEKPLSHYRVPLPCSDEPRVLLVVEFENYYYCSTHFSLLLEYREEAARIICEEAKKLNKTMIVAGDLNAQRSESTIKTLAEHFHVFEKNGSNLTFPAGSPTKEIDYICLYKDNGAAAVVHESYVQYEPVASDHRPIVVDMTICE